MGPVERGVRLHRAVGKSLLHIVQRFLFGLVDCLLGGNHLFSGRHHDCMCRLTALGKAPDGEFERLKRGNIDIYKQLLDGAIPETRINWGQTLRQIQTHYEFNSCLRPFLLG